MLDIIIRKITIEDSESIAILSGQLGYSSSIEETKDRIKKVNISKDNCAYVAVFNNVIVGWIHAFFAIHIESGAFCEIGGLVIDERFRGRGIGKQLVNKIKEWCIENKYNRLRLRCSVKRLAAHGFYNSIGFTKTKESKIFEMPL